MDQFETSRATANETEIVQRFGDAAAALMRAYLDFARADDPEAYAELSRAVAEGRARPEILVQFAPQPCVSLRMVGQGPEDVAEIVRYIPRIAAPHERH